MKILLVHSQCEQGTEKPQSHGETVCHGYHILHLISNVYCKEQRTITVCSKYVNTQEFLDKVTGLFIVNKPNVKKSFEHTCGRSHFLITYNPLHYSH